MVYQIVSHTPPFVFLVFALLLWRGARQLAPSEVKLTRAVLLPVVFTLFSGYAVLSAFPHAASAILAWAAALAASASLMLARGPKPGTRFDAALGRLVLPGSVLPMVLMLGTFCTRYAMAVCLAIQPAWRDQAAFVLGSSALCGLLAGCFAGQALTLAKLALRPAASVN